MVLIGIVCLFNPLVPRMQEIKIRNLNLNRLLIVEFVKNMIHLGVGINGLKMFSEPSMRSYIYVPS